MERTESPGPSYSAVVPTDLFIPPDALEVLLERFTGPLDLLLYLIRRQNIDILDIPMALITSQYLAYIQKLEQRLELAGEYLMMAAMLIEIKSRMLLPRPCEVEEAEQDPRNELVKKLFLYEQFKEIALQLDALPRAERDTFCTNVNAPECENLLSCPQIGLQELVRTMQQLLESNSHSKAHFIKPASLSVHDRIDQLLEQLDCNNSQYFTDLLSTAPGRPGLIITFLAVLELARQSIIHLKQRRPFDPLFIQVVHA